MPKLWRVEVERTETSVVYVMADDEKSAGLFAEDAANDLDRVEWESGGGPKALFFHVMSEPEGQGGMSVDNDPEGRTVAEWLEADGE